ncbi:MAG: murein biosynthesis integral membrane protein MurJ [Pseudonocardiales bacterium]|nr:MAG: murein biosynthesis integral membrane protein MurJ [Pseudonocardiales bacterium]
MTEQGAGPDIGSVGRAGRAMAVGTIASRGTGFVRSLVLVAVLGVQLVPDAYNAANTLPNMVYELLLGGILTSVFVPLIVKSQKEDADGGAAYTQRLLTLTVVVLGAATVIAVVAAPLLIGLQGFDAHDRSQHDLAVTLARLLLPEILFYGIGASLAAVLNSRGQFAAPMWAPVVNNLVVIVTCGLFLALPGSGRLTPATITSAQVLVLGIGTTLGIVAQAAVLWPALRRVGFRWRWRLDVGRARLGEAARLAGWMLAYVAISQVGVIVIQRLAILLHRAHPDVPGLTVLVNASLLFMLPHGIVAVSIITALLPRMSRAAVDGRLADVARDLSLGTRLSSVILLPVSAAFLALGPAIGVLLYSYGRSSTTGGRDIGLALAAGALGLLPFAVSQMQIFAFYALRDTRTPALVNLAVVGVKVAIDLVLYATLPPANVVEGLMWGNTASYLVAVIVSGWLLGRRLGGLDSARVLRTVVRLSIAAVIGGLLAWAVAAGVVSRLGNGPLAAVVVLVGGSLLGGVAYLAVALRLRVTEVQQVTGPLKARLGR